MSAVTESGLWRRLREAGVSVVPRPIAWRAEDIGEARRHFTWVLSGIAATVLAAAVTGLLMWRYPQFAGWLWIAQIVLLVGLVAMVGTALVCVQRCLLRPLTQIREWATELRRGNLSARVPQAHSGELGALSRDINELGDAMQVLSRNMAAEVEKHTERLAQKTRSLELLYEVAAGVSVSGDLDELLARLLHRLQALIGARAACARVLTDDGQMRLVASVGLGAEVTARERLMSTEQCLCGQSIREGRVLQQPGLERCEALIGQPFFDGRGARLIAVPLQYRDRTLGVYNLFVDADSDAVGEDVEALLTSIGRHIGIAVERGKLDQQRQRLSRMEERARLANELHDSLAQTLASLRFQVRVLDETLHQGDDCKIWEEMERVERSLDDAYAELRELIAHFRAPIDKRGLIPAVETAVARFRQETDIAIFLQNQWQGEDLPEEMELQVLRIIQEALTNIRKHSHANAVRVMLRSDPSGRYRILIEDDGIGFDEPPASDHPGQHIGLSILRERAESLGGDLRVDSERGEGTRIELTFRGPDHSDSGKLADDAGALD